MERLHVVWVERQGLIEILPRFLQTPGSLENDAQAIERHIIRGGEDNRCIEARERCLNFSANFCA